METTSTTLSATESNAPTVPADCLKCGACCFSTLEAYARVTGDDWTRLDTEAERVAHFIGNRAYMKMRDGHCAALERRTDSTSGETIWFCTVYERRPQICRALARGSPECQGELTTKKSRTCH